MKRTIRSVALVALGAGFVTGMDQASGQTSTQSSPAVSELPQRYSFAIVPQQSARTLLHRWGPVLRELSARSGLQLQFATGPDIPTFEQRLLEGEYDFAYMNPYHYTVMHERPGYEAVAHARDRRIKGIIVVRADSPINSLEDLGGSRLAFPAPAAFAATLLTQAALRTRNIPFEPSYVSSHDSVYQSVAREFYPAGGGVIRTLNSTDSAVREELRILWTTPGYTPHAIAVHPRVPAPVVDALRRALVELGDDPSSREVLKALAISGFQSAADADWDDVRALGIDASVGTP